MLAKVTILLAILVLLLTIPTHATSSPYQLSPALPPTAFVDQYYTCTFRVGGLTKPRFSFSHLPPPLTGSKNGNIEGIPSASGSYRVTVSFNQEDEEGSQQVLLIVVLPEFNTSAVKRRDPRKKIFPWQMDVQTMYELGDVIDISLGKYAPNNQYNWTYLHLPDQLTADGSGRINGIIWQEGYYSFAAICADQNGTSFDYFFTLNIQPMSYDYSTYYQVPLRNTFPYDSASVDSINADASINAAQKLKLFNEANDNLVKCKRDVSITASNKDKATTQLNVIQQLKKLIGNQVTKLYDYFNNVTTKLKKMDGIFQLKKTAYNQAQNITKDAENAFNTASDYFNKTKQALSNRSSQFIAAQTQSSKAASSLMNAQMDQQMTTQEVNSTFQVVMQSKQILQGYTSTATLASFNVSTAFNDKGIASFQNDAASAAYDTTNSNLNKGFQNLQTANSSVFMLQQSLSDAKIALGSAQFNLTQAMSNLYVAQAAKAQSDKMLLIASAQSVQLPSTSTSIFAGCSMGNYPSIFGTTTITSSTSSGYELNSGYKMLYGGCTKMGNFSIGDNVSFEGYLKDGFIHAVRMD